ncbi:MAG: zinc ribbon domain-containing protein [Promethearchaeota archaeon]|nr:MAG: zinc ribbon domain-containing protein [Candidatus Lokiarchaeota archaeon]
MINVSEVKDKCGKCGAKVSPGYDFCLSCGTKFSEVPPITKVRDNLDSSSAIDLVLAASDIKNTFCFIATAAYGSHLSPQVSFLRYVRDKRLKRTRLGYLFVDRFEWLYYKFSPDVAKVMYRFPFFKRVMKWLLVTPIVYFLMAIFKPADSIRKKFQKIV